MQFLKLCCLKETFRADIELGGIKKRGENGEPQLVLNVSISYGSIRQATDFLYLQPQNDHNIENLQQQTLVQQMMLMKQDYKNIQTNTSTASSQINARKVNENQMGQLKQKDLELLPKRLKDVKKERVILIEKSGMCDNLGTGYIDLQTKKGNYKIYYMRIENEQRILSNSKLEILGESVQFTLDQLSNNDDSSSQNRASRKQLAVADSQVSYEESYSYSNQDSLNTNFKHQQQNRIGSPTSYAESSLDSAVLMRQIQSQQVNQNSYSQSVYSSDVTKMLNPGSLYGDADSISHQFENNQSSQSQLASEGNSRYIMSQSQSTYLNHNDENQMISSNQNNKNSKHRRAQNMQFALEDISNTNMPKRMNNQQTALSGPQTQKHHYYSRKIEKGKENNVIEYDKAIRNRRNPNEISLEQKSNSFTNGIIMRKKGNNTNLAVRNAKYQNQNYDINHAWMDNNEAQDDLDVHYVNDIESLVPPRYNPDTRTYFKCSIYSPSNRLYTVNEEVNSTQSDAGEQFSSSQIMSGFRISGCLLANKLSPGYTDRQYDENEKIDEEENDDEDPENLSEGMVLPQTPTPKITQQMKSHFAKETNSGKFSTNISGTHTRTSSSKAQSLRGSIHIQRPLGSHFSSISSLVQNPQNNQQVKNNDKVDKQLINKFLRETFNGVLPSETGVEHLQRAINSSQNTNDNLNLEVQKYFQPLPGSFVCPRGTEFKNEQPNSIFGLTKTSMPPLQQSSQDSLTKVSRSSKNKNEKTNSKKNSALSIEKTLIKLPQAVGSRKSSNNQSSSNNSSIIEKSVRDQSPETYYDEENRKVVIISNDIEEGNQIQHCIKWGTDTDPTLVGKAIEEVITKVKRSTKSPKKSKRSLDINQKPNNQQEMVMHR